MRHIACQDCHLRVLDKTVKLRGYSISIGQLAVTDLGHVRSTLRLSEQLQASAADLLDRYARGMVIENGSSDPIDFFHMDALSSGARLKIDTELQYTTMAGTPYRLLALRMVRAMRGSARAMRGSARASGSSAMCSAPLPSASSQSRSKCGSSAGPTTPC